MITSLTQNYIGHIAHQSCATSCQMESRKTIKDNISSTELYYYNILQIHHVLMAIKKQKNRVNTSMNLVQKALHVSWIGWYCLVRHGDDTSTWMQLKNCIIDRSLNKVHEVVRPARERNSFHIHMVTGAISMDGSINRRSEAVNDWGPQ